jgi:hypothetical protein
MADESSSTKYHQVAVPDHPGGSSFVRMGSFPSGGDPAPLPASYEKAKALAGVGASRLTTSGHWSHTDGNRITTTVGNVVDIIQGSYLAFRSAAASPPGPTLNASWASWSYVQVGSSDYPVGDGAAAGDPTGTQPDPFEVTYATSQGVTDTTAVDPAVKTGDVIVATWAGRVMTYVGSSSKPVTYAFTQTYAGKAALSTYTTVDNATLVKATGGDVTTTVDVSGGGDVKTTVDVSGGGGVKTITNVSGGKVLTTVESDAITTLNTAPAITTVNTAVNILNQNLGIVENTNEGAVFNVTLGFASNIVLGGQFNFSFPDKFDLSPETTEVHGIKNRISIAETKLGTTETNIRTLISGISSVTSKIEAMRTDIGTVRTEVNDVRTSVGAAKDEVHEEVMQLASTVAVMGLEIMLG